jgi:translation initiation factor IF-1
VTLTGGLLCLTPIVLLVLVGCHSTPLPPESQWKTSTYQQEAGGAGFGGQVVVNTTTTNATVVSIDSARRTLLLKYPDGQTTTYQAGPEVKRFNQIKVGDVVKATRTEERALSLEKTGTLTNISTNESAVALPDGGKPGIKAVRIVRFTAKVVSVDPMGHQATLQLADGQTRTERVRDTVNLADLKPGDTVSVRLIEMRTVLVETP